MFEPWPLWLSWLEHCPVDQKVTDLIPDQGTYPHYGFDSQSMCVRKSSQFMFLSQIHVSLSLSFSLPLPL